MVRIAVVGAGIFGSTTAIVLARNGFDVDLIEREDGLLKAASGVNQYRLHRGYHYPRSKETALSSKQAEGMFVREYGEAVYDTCRHHYAIAREGSFVTGKQFIEFCDSCGLEHAPAELPVLDPSTVELVIEAREHVFDPYKLRDIVEDRIREHRVNLVLNKEFTADDAADYDIIVNCTYANLNTVLAGHPEEIRDYQFELCEKPVLRLPAEFKGVSLVVMDGPFTCIDPLADTGLHLMGNVVHAIHSTNTGRFPVIPEEFKPLLNNGIVERPSVTNIGKFIESASFFMPSIREAVHVGSMYTVRTVLPRVDATDERPTFVYPVGDKIINVFSGKIGNSVEAAERVLGIALERVNASVVGASSTP